MRAKAFHFKIVDIPGFYKLFFNVYYKVLTHRLNIRVKYTYFHNLIKDNQIIVRKWKRNMLFFPRNKIPLITDVIKYKLNPE